MSNLKQIRILVVDDHVVVRRGLIFVLQAFNDLQTVGEVQFTPERIDDRLLLLIKFFFANPQFSFK